VAPAVSQLELMTMQKITPFLWFDGNAEEAMNFYMSIFDDAKITNIARYSDVGPGQAGSVMTAAFTLCGQDFIALNGGPQYKFTPAVSFVVSCETQAEVDRYWDALVAGGQPVQCGWLTDKYGLSWQIVPVAVWTMMQDKDPERSARVMQAVFKMIKLDIAELQRAYDGR
jgi:predicted 3-demethylubiquinone-9 3-methyltransferase (glyoxalase superfamily)